MEKIKAYIVYFKSKTKILKEAGFLSYNFFMDESGNGQLSPSFYNRFIIVEGFQIYRVDFLKNVNVLVS